MTQAPQNDDAEGRLTVLYVDDSAAQLAAFRQALEHGPYRLYTATTSRDALQRMAAGLPDLVIIDYHMPEMMGDACLKLLRAAGAANTRYYLYTTDATAFRRHREMGFDGVLMLKGKTSVRTQVDAIAKAMMHFRG